MFHNCIIYKRRALPAQRLNVHNSHSPTETLLAKDRLNSQELQLSTLPDRKTTNASTVYFREMQVIFVAIYFGERGVSMPPSITF